MKKMFGVIGSMPNNEECEKTPSRHDFKRNGVDMNALMNTEIPPLKFAVESSGTNAFFIKNEMAQDFEILSASKSWKAVDRHNSDEQIKFIKESVKNYKFIEL